MKPAPFDYLAPRERGRDGGRARPARRRRQGARGRPEPGADAQSPPRAAGGAGGHQRRRASSTHLREAEGLVHVGALRRQAGVERWAVTRLPLMAEALRAVGHAAIRNRGTVAGSVAHADPASELPALLLCLDGAAVARGAGGERVIPAGELFRAPLTTVAPRRRAGHRGALLPAAAGRGLGLRRGGPPPRRLRPRRRRRAALAGRRRARGRRAAGAVRRGRHAASAAARRRRCSPARRRAPSAIREAARAAAAVLRPDGDLHASARYRERGGGGRSRSARLTAALGALPEGGMTRPVRLTVNGQTREGAAEPRLSLADFLREDLDLTGTHVGCEHGVCGACTVLLDGEPIRACLMLAVQAAGRSITTVEGLAPGGRAQPAPAGVPGQARPPVRLLHAGHPAHHAGVPAREPEPHARGDP